MCIETQMQSRQTSRMYKSTVLPLLAGVSFGVGHFLVFWLTKLSFVEAIRQWFYRLFE